MAAARWGSGAWPACERGETGDWRGRTGAGALIGLTIWRGFRSAVKRKKIRAARGGGVAWWGGPEEDSRRGGLSPPIDFRVVFSSWSVWSFALLGATSTAWAIYIYYCGSDGVGLLPVAGLLLAVAKSKGLQKNFKRQKKRNRKSLVLSCASRFMVFSFDKDLHLLSISFINFFCAIWF